MKKSIWAFIVLLALVLTVLLSGCGADDIPTKGKKETEKSRETAGDSSQSVKEETEAFPYDDVWADMYTGLPLLERNDQDTISDTELCSAIYSACLDVIEPWMKEGAIDYSREAVAGAGAAVYAWAQEVKARGFVDDCTLCEESGTVAFFLKSGGIDLFSLPIRQTYSGDQYVAVGIEGLSWIDDAVITALDQFSRFHITGSHEAAAYIEKHNENYTHKNISAGKLTIDSLISFLESIPDQHIRVIFWRSHGDLFEGLDKENHLALIIQDKVTDEKEKRYSDDIKEKRILHSGNHYAISDGFFDKFLPEVDGGLFCCGACFSGADGGKTAEVFFGKGFDCYIGPSSSVWTTYSDKMLGQFAVHLCERENDKLLTAYEALLRAIKDVGEHDVYGTFFTMAENPQKAPFRLIPDMTEKEPETSSPEPITDNPAFTEENISPYRKHVTDLAYAVLQRGSVYSLSGSLEMTRSEAATRFKLNTDGALFTYSYLNNELLLEPVFEGTYDAENNVRYCKTNQEEIVRTLKALLDLDISREDFPAVYDSYESPLCIWNQNGLYLCVPMMGEGPWAAYRNLVLTEGKALLYADVFEPFNNIPTDQLVITLVPAENELGFTIESISLNPNSSVNTGLGDGYYALWTAMKEVASGSSAPGGRNYDALEEDYAEGKEVTFTMKSSGRYIKFTKDYIETTFTLDLVGTSNGHGGHMLYNEMGYVIRVPVSPAIRNPMPSVCEDIIAYYEWLFTEGPCELFDFKVQDGIVTLIETKS